MKANTLLLPFLLFILPSCQQVNGESNDDPNGSEDEQLQRAIRELANAPALKKGRVSFLLRDLNSGERIAAHRAQELIVPASTQKLVTTISALRILGADHRFRTFLGYKGRIKEGTLHGDLILKGGGDPAFLSKEFAKHYGSPEALFRKMVQACRSTGIERVKGKLLVDASYFPSNTLSRGRIWEDMGNYFGAFPSGMNIGENAFQLHFRTPEKAGRKAELLGMEPKLPWLRIENRVKSSDVRKDRAYIYGKPYDTRRIVEGTLPKGRDSYSIEGALPDPARTAAWTARSHMGEEGLAITEGYSSLRLANMKEYSMDGILDTVHSPPLQDIVRVTNFESKNLFAETLLLQIAKSLGAEAKPRPAGKALLERIDRWGIDTEGIRLADGSGLAPTNRVTAAFLVETLEKAWKGDHRGIIKHSLPVAGKSGTMSYIGGGTSAEGRVWAKSGYMDGVLGYAGYARDSDGEWKAFALIANDFTGSPANMRELMEPVLVGSVE